jgi:hypothetical protein
MSNNFFQNILGKRQKKMLQFHNSIIIDVDTSDTASSSDDSSSTSLDEEDKI